MTNLGRAWSCRFWRENKGRKISGSLFFYVPRQNCCISTCSPNCEMYERLRSSAKRCIEPRQHCDARALSSRKVLERYRYAVEANTRYRRIVRSTTRAEGHQDI